MAKTQSPPFAAHFGANQEASIVGVVGTLGTADTAGTARIIPVGVDPATGAAYVYNLGPAGSTTVSPNLPVIAGTPADAGTYVSIRLTDGTTYYTASSGGSFTNVASGTQQTLGTVGVVNNLVKGTVTSVEGGTLGLITRVGNIGTIESGTVTTTLALNSGTITTIQAGTQNTLGTVGVVNSIAAGTQNTLGTVGVVNNLVKGTITRVEGGTIGLISALSVGTVVGATASGGTPTTNPVLIAGTDATGTVYAPLITAAGLLNIVDVPKGTITNVGTVVGAGTITNLGSVTNIGVVHNAGSVAALPDLPGGTVDLVSQANVTVGTFTADIPGGTVDLVTTVTTVSNVTNGSINILTGTIQSSGTTTGVGVVSNLTNGSVNLLTGTVTSVTNLAGGTVQINSKPVTTVVSQGTLGTAGGSFFGTISAASGVGTNHYVSNVDIVMQSGTADVRVLAGTGIQGTGVIAAGFFAPSSGIAKHFSPAFFAGANSELTYHFVGAGTAFITVNYWKQT